MRQLLKAWAAPTLGLAMFACTRSSPAPTSSNPSPESKIETRASALSGTSPGHAIIHDAGCFANTLERCDDCFVQNEIPLPFDLNFLGRTYSGIYVNNNGNLSFIEGHYNYTPYALDGNHPDADGAWPIIAPYFGDVWTLNFDNSGNPVADGGSVTYGNTTYNGHDAFCATWEGVGVGYYVGFDARNKFQVLLVDRSDRLRGDFDIVFNYDQVQWETGAASCFDYNQPCAIGGLAGNNGYAARVGYWSGPRTDGTVAPNALFELPGSGQAGAFLDSNLDTGLVHNNYPVDPNAQAGRYTFEVRNTSAIGTGSISGTVTDSMGTPIPGAAVQVCTAIGNSCPYVGVTDASGHYRAPGIADGDYVANAFPPSDQNFLLPGTRIDIVLGAGQAVTGADVMLEGVVPPPPNTSISPSHTGGGTVVVYWQQPLTLTTHSCPNASGANYSIFQNGTAFMSGSFTEAPAGSGTYTTTIPPFYPNHGTVSIVMHFLCPDGSNPSETFDIYIDPSGTVRDTLGRPVAGATVEILVFDQQLRDYVSVPDGSAILSPSNRRNPDLTSAGGEFGWDTLAGFYKVRASKTGCVDADRASAHPGYAETNVLQVPPPQLGLVLTLECDECPNDPEKLVPGACGCGTPDIDSDGDRTPDCNDLCPNDSSKTAPGTCGCGISDADSDGDGTADCADGCPSDPTKTAAGVCGCGAPETDADGDGTPACNDACDGDANKTAAGICGCGVSDADSDRDGTADCNDGCPGDPAKTAAGQCGCGTPDTDADGDGAAACNDACEGDPSKTSAGICGCGVADIDSDGDGTADCRDACPADPAKVALGVCGCGVAETDSDGDGAPDCADGCAADPTKTSAGICGCGVADTDTDGDGTADCDDACARDPAKTAEGVCGCGVSDVDTDSDGTADCLDACPLDAGKTAVGICGCGVSDADGDGDGTADCQDGCPGDAAKIAAGQCGCGSADTDTDGDGTADCNDRCPANPGKVEPGQCGCLTSDRDSDGDSTPDCFDRCPGDPDKIEEGQCGCGFADTDGDHDGTADCADQCPADANKTAPGLCGCGSAETDSDGDGTPDCLDLCPNSAAKLSPGQCGCDVADTDADSDGTADCNDGCENDPGKVGPGQCGCGSADTDSDGDGVADCHDACSTDPAKTDPGQCGCGRADTDSDGDGTADCRDACVNDPAKVSAGQCGCGRADTDTDRDGIADCRDTCPLNPNPDQNPAICTDSDGDGVSNAQDQCAGTPRGEVVQPGVGCSIAQLVPCAAPRGGGTWRNHGEYVSSVTQTADRFRAAGLITGAQHGAITSAAARSSCGK